MSAPVVGRVGVSGVSFESAGTVSPGVSGFGGVSPFAFVSTGVSPVGLLSGDDVHVQVGVGVGVLWHWQLGVAVGVGVLLHWQFGVVEPQLGIATPDAPISLPQTSWLAAPAASSEPLADAAEPLAVAASALPPPHNTSTAKASPTTTEAAIDLIGHLCSLIEVPQLRPVVTSRRARTGAG